MTTVVDSSPAQGRAQRRRERRSIDAAGFRPDIEGLRAVAVLLVVGFHVGLPGFTGGYIGVDVFFVISGFLITRLLLVQDDDAGRISLRDFYARRARRIVPNVALVVAVTGLAAWVMLPPLAVRAVAGDMVASSLFVANWRFIGQGNDYLALDIDHSPLLHLWSMSVEEQFYLVWPLLIVVVALVARRFGRSRDALALLAVGTISAASLAWAIVATASDAPFAYMATPARAWQFGAGALLALVLRRIPRAATRNGALTAGAVSWIGLASLGIASVVLSRLTPYPGTAALLPVAATAAMIVAGHVAMPSASAGALLGTRAVRGVGRLSFAWYLWHWPVLVLAAAVSGTVVSWPVAAVLALASALPAYLSMRLVERPLRFAPSVRVRATAGLSVGVVASVAALLAGLWAGTAATQVLVAQTDVPSSARATESLARALEATASRAAMPGAGVSAPLSGMLTPSPLRAAGDLPQPYSCQLQKGQVTGPACQFGTRGGPSVVLFGDSHAQQWQTAMITLAQQRGWFLTVLTKSGCPADDLPADGSGARYALPDCIQWRTAALARIARQLRPRLIVLASRENYVSSATERESAWAATLARLTPLGVPIVHILDSPYPGFDVPTCLSGALRDWSRCAFPRSASTTPDPVRVLLDAGLVRGVAQLDVTDLICPDATCPAASGGVLLYRDESHLSDTFVRALLPAFTVRLDTAAITPTP